MHAAHLYSTLYKDNVVQWDGYYIETKRRRGGGFGGTAEMSILIKMDPSESDSFADILLQISEEAYKKNKDVIDILKKGDHVNFRAKMKTMGNEFKLHHLRLMPETGSIEDTGQTENYDHISVHESKLP